MEENKIEINVILYKSVSFDCPYCKEFQMLFYNDFIEKHLKSNLLYWLDWYDKEFQCPKCKKRLIIEHIDW